MQMKSSRYAELMTFASKYDLFCEISKRFEPKSSSIIDKSEETQDIPDPTPEQAIIIEDAKNSIKMLDEAFSYALKDAKMTGNQILNFVRFETGPTYKTIAESEFNIFKPYHEKFYEKLNELMPEKEENNNEESDNE